MANVKCRYCKNSIDKESAYSPSSKIYYCSEECYTLHEESKKKEEVKDKSDYVKWKDFIKFIYNSNGIDDKYINWVLLMSQTKNIMAEHKDWNYAQLTYVLKYMYEIECINLFSAESNGSIISLLPFYFQSAKEFAIKSQHIKQLVKDFDFDDNIVVVKKGNIDRCKKWREIKLDEL